MNIRVILTAVAIVLLFVLVTVSFILQIGTFREMAMLRKENFRLTRELAQNAQAQQAQAANLRAQLNELRGMALGQVKPARLPGNDMLVEPRGRFLQTTRDVQGLPLVEPQSPGRVSSSHTPDGQLQSRSWGPEQVLGPPNTEQAGDFGTAWAQRLSNGGEEWLQVSFEKPADIAEVIVRETYNPGAISKVAALSANGQETILWQGTEPPVEAPVDMSFPAKQGIQASSVKIYFDRRRAPGWNEIDAVELVGRDGSRQWAVSATASSSFAEQ